MFDLKLVLKNLKFVRKFKAGGKPSTWFPPEGLVEQKLRTVFERNTINEGKMRHKNKDAKENKRRTRGKSR